MMKAQLAQLQRQVHELARLLANKIPDNVGMSEGRGQRQHGGDVSVVVAAEVRQQHVDGSSGCDQRD